jgi:predicted DCC family thiol-disulfide oxidoreductase YuxK
VAGKGRAWLLYDGDCGFCTRLAAWVEGRDRERRLRVVAYQEAPSPPMTPELRQACAEALHAITPQGRVLRGGDATIFTLGALGWRVAARVLWLRPLRDVVGFGYRVVAGMRGCEGCDR